MKSTKHAGPSGKVVVRRPGPEDAGYVVSGPGFYVWREHHSEALGAAAELAGSLTLDQMRRLSHPRSEADPGSEEPG